MPDEPASAGPAASIQPIVLVGGRSTRFGRDKLLEPLDQGLLVDRPIAALRGVFGRRVLTVGDCDPRVAVRADGAIWDRYPGAGPIGGILSALEAIGTDVFVLPGDLPWIDAATVRTLVAAAARSPEAWAVLAEAERLEPCVGVYRPAAIAPLAHSIADGSRALHAALDPARVRRIAVDPSALANANTPADLPRRV